ncbi:MAG: MFS transporter [Frankia sp.]
MSSTTVEEREKPSVSPVNRLWNRQLSSYPDTRARYTYLGIVVLAAIVLYYELYVEGSVAPSILRQYDMSFTYFIYIIAFGNILGAFASLVAGLADRWGRANLVAYGLGITAAITLFGLPNAGSEFMFGVCFAALSFVEGIILVATPALVRDFSPQIGRAGAMGFWTLGPVLGSLVVAVVSSNTLAGHPDWRYQFYVSGAAGFVIFAVALVGLRELSPQLRDQLMMTIRDRALIEAKAKGLDISKALEKPWKQMMRPDIIASALAISLFLLIYYSAVEFSVVYFTTVFGFTEKDANGVSNWLWASDAIALVVVGVLSDKLRVRKPFMIVGGVGAVVMTIIFLRLATHPDTSYYHLATVMAIQAVFLGVAYAPWMASFTETIEKHNPALTATGLAVWGWILRIVVAAAAFVVPVIVNGVDPLVAYGPQAQAAQARVGAPLLAKVEANQALFNQLATYPDASKIPPALLSSAIAKVGAPTLLAAQKHTADLKYLSAHGNDVLAAQKKAPHQWQHWYWICVGGQLVFIPLVFMMAGDWSPRRARQREEEHEAAVQAELEKMLADGSRPVGVLTTASPAATAGDAATSGSDATTVPAPSPAPVVDGTTTPIAAPQAPATPATRAAPAAPATPAPRATPAADGGIVAPPDGQPPSSEA